jgi:DNA-binding NarL/FixJ family response regulator
VHTERILSGAPALDDVVARLGERGPGRLVAAVIEGERGAGKTTLWRDAVERARERGYRVLACRPVEPEAPWPFAGLTDLLDGVADAEFGHLPDPQRRALEIVLLRASPDGAPPDPRAVNVAALGLVRLLAGRRPVVLAVDDTQWLDPASAGVLDYIARRSLEHAVGLLIVVRAGSSPATPVPFGLDRDRTHRFALPAAARRPRPGFANGVTGRERAVLTLLVGGLTANAIAHRLGTSPRTVHKHLENLYRKLGASDRLTAVLRAQRLGLLPGAGETGTGQPNRPVSR